MVIDTLFIDLDNTILDFCATEAHVLGRALRQHGIEPSPEVVALYQRINEEQWVLLEEGKVPVEDIGARRFEIFLKELGYAANPQALSETYDGLLKECCFFMPGAVEMLEALSKQYRLYMMTNGMDCVQYGRIHRANIEQYFEQIFISSDIGHAKPSQEFFEVCFAKIDDFDRERAAILGDGLNSDIHGGVEAGLRTIWLNYAHKPNDTEWQPDVEVQSLKEVPAVLAQWNQEEAGTCEG